MRFLYDTHVPDATPDHPLLRAVIAPFVRLSQTGPAEKVLGVLGGGLTWVMADAFTLIVLLLVASAAADTIYGRALAKAVDKYDAVKAEIGMHSKIMGIVLVLLLRGFEGWWAVASTGGPFDGFHTNGFASAAVAIALFVLDLKSIQEKRVRFGQAPLPILNRVLNGIDRIATALGAPDPDADVVDRRRSDDPGSTAFRRRSTDQEENDAE